MNKKLYVGVTYDLEKRWSEHKSKCRNYKFCSHIYNAFNKYGHDNFYMYPIQVFSDKEEALEVEKYWISYLKEQEIELYNIANGGQGRGQYTMSQSTKAQKIKSLNREKELSFPRNISRNYLRLVLERLINILRRLKEKCQKIGLVNQAH